MILERFRLTDLSGRAKLAGVAAIVASGAVGGYALMQHEEGKPIPSFFVPEDKEDTKSVQNSIPVECLLTKNLVAHNEKVSLRYVLQKGDTLTRLAIKYGLRDEKGLLLTNRLAEFNGIKNMNYILAGSSFYIPLNFRVVKSGEDVSRLLSKWSVRKVGSGADLARYRDSWIEMVTALNSLKDPCPNLSMVLLPAFSFEQND